MQHVIRQGKDDGLLNAEREEFEWLAENMADLLGGTKDANNSTLVQICFGPNSILQSRKFTPGGLMANAPKTSMATMESDRMNAFFRLGMLGLVATLALSGCFEETDEDYTLPRQKYVAMGNSLTAGYQSGGLGEQFQENSYPKLLAEAMGVNDFEQPLIERPGIGSTTDSLGRPQGPLSFDLGSQSLRAPTLTKAPTDMLLRKTLPKPYGNLGVPGALTADVLGAYSAKTAYSYKALGTANPYFDIVLRGESLMNAASMLQQAIAQNPEIITLEIGNNDVLGGVTSGTIVLGVTVTPPPVFAGLMKTIVDSLLKSTEATVFIGNIPKPTLTPYVTAIPTFILDPKTFTPVLDSSVSPPRTIPLLTEEADVKRVLVSAFFRIMSGEGIPTALGGTGKPLPARYTLTAVEEATADSVVVEYNAAIDALVTANRSRTAVVDINQLLQDLNDNKISGLSAQHPLLQLLMRSTGSTPASPSAFSYDGIHPNAQGYRMMASAFLSVINVKLNTQYALK